MTNETEVERQGRRAVACKHWRWLPGMLAIVPAAHDGATGYVYRLTEASGPVNSARAYPDVTDAATRGCILELVRQAWTDQNASPFLSNFFNVKTWHIAVIRNDETIFFRMSFTEMGCLILALEAAHYRA